MLLLGLVVANEMVEFRVSCMKEGRTQILSAMTFPITLWVEIEDFIVRNKPIENMPKNCAFEKKNSEEGWFNIRLVEPFELVAESTNVFCIFRDIQNLWAKSGMAFDIMELVPVVN